MLADSLILISARCVEFEGTRPTTRRVQVANGYSGPGTGCANRGEDGDRPGRRAKPSGGFFNDDSAVLVMALAVRDRHRARALKLAGPVGFQAIDQPKSASPR
jgi:hypothetical protein